ncbi:unnamed protein product [Miscanthus lutarioriparius]|uniref:Uncharacterized protein n=1 Tax=Miscanthus lutarioriparius TaxID=422564 RepID=A0A811P6C3_9POAL|nr:unnamed protein product [Miscanthus lutarioriparius]
MPARAPAAGHAAAATPWGMRSRSSSPDRASAARASRPPLPRASRAPVATRYSTPELFVRCGGPPLREVVAASDVRPRPPPPPPGRELELFDLVEAYHSDGWWPGLVSDIQPKRRRNQETQFAVSLPLFREVVVLSASFVRPSREFVYRSSIDAQEVLRGIPQYAEGSRIEVMCDKQGRVWRPAIIKKMVGSTNYVVSYGNGESSIEVLHTRFTWLEPISDKMKLEYELKPSAEVEERLFGLIMLLRCGLFFVSAMSPLLSAIWRELGTLSPQLSPDTCDSCRKQQSHLELRRTYDFLTRLRAEFEPLRAQLLAREPCVSLMEALAAVRNEETRLHSASLLQSTSSSVLAARSGILGSPPKVPASAASGGSGTRNSGGLHCKHCGRDGHDEDHCYKKKRQAQSQSRRGGRSSHAQSQHPDAQQEILMLLRRLAVPPPTGASGSVTTRAAGSVTPAPVLSAATSQSFIERPPSTSGILPWILDSGASFHMTPDSTSLSSICSPSIPLTVQTVDGSSLSVVGLGTLSSSSFHVPNVSYVPDLTMQIISAGQLTDHGCRVIFYSDTCCVQDLSMGLLVGTGPRRHDSPHLWELGWLRLPSAASVGLVSSASPASASSSFAQWHHRLGHLCGSRLSTLVRRGVLGNVSGDVSLDQCQGCVIADVGSCEPRRYRVKVKEHSNAYGNDYMIVSSASLRPKAKWDSPEWRIRSTKKHTRKRNYSDSDSDYSSDSGYSPEFSTPGGNSDLYSSIPNKRVRKENAQMEEVHLRHSLNLRQDTGSSSLKHVMDMEIPSEKHVSRVKKLERERVGLGFGVVKGEEQILEANAVKLICTPCDGKGRHSLPKALASKRKDLSVSSLDDVIEIGSKYNFGDAVVISDDSSHGSFIEISDDSSCNPIKMQSGGENQEMCPKITEIDTENKKTGISPEEAAAFLIGKLEPPSSGQKGVKADLVCIEARNDNKVEIKNERMGMSLVSAEGFHLETCRNLFSTTSLLLMPKNKMEVFEKLPQNPHFRKAWNCPPELRGGRAIGHMVSFADMAESIKNMRIQDEPRLYEEKMSILLYMEEENGFEAGPLKVRLHNLLCTRTCQINLKSRKLQVDLCQVEESLKYVEAVFCSIATAPWQSDAAPCYSILLRYYGSMSAFFMDLRENDLLSYVYFEYAVCPTYDLRICVF